MKLLAAIAILLCLASVLVAAWHHPDRYEWDFRTYYVATKAYQAGLDPYDIASLKAVSHTEIEFAYRYPLACLYVFAPLTRLDMATAQRVWLIMKLIALAGLLAVWRRSFLQSTPLTLLLLVAVFGFNAAMLWDLEAGNVSVFEQLLMWSGLSFLCARRFNLFTALIVASALFKVLPAAILLLLLAPGVRNGANLVRALVGLLVLAVLLLGPYSAHASLLHSFLSQLGGPEPRVGVNPSAMGIIAAVARHLPIGPASRLWEWFAWFAYCLGLALWSWPLLSRVLAGRDLRATVMIFVMLYGLVVPRLMIYSYLVFVVPVLGLVLPAIGQMRNERYVFGALLSMQGLGLLPPRMGSFATDALPYVLAMGCWATLVWKARRMDPVEAQVP